MNQLIDGTYNQDTQLFKELYDSLIYGIEGNRPDVYYVLADFDAYVKAQEEVAAAYQDKMAWAKKALLNILQITFWDLKQTLLESTIFLQQTL